MSKTKKFNFKIKKNPQLFLFLGIIILILIHGRVIFNEGKKLILPKSQPQTAQSEFGQMLDEAKKKEEEAKKAAEEKKRQEEETKKFIAQYGPCRNVPILMYHHVGDNPTSGAWLYVGVNTFVSQMDYLVGKGYTTVTLPEVMASLQNGSVLPAKPIVLTFDDGYRDIYTNAYPVLKEKSLRATLFLPTQLLDGSNYLTWEQVKEMLGSGLITAGDHTLSHSSLPILSEARLKDEIISAKNILETNLGVKVNVFAYPYGNSNGEAEKILQEGSFVAAVTTKRGLACAKLPYELPRIRIGNTPLSNFGL